MGVKENWGNGWIDRGPRRMTDYDDLPRKAGTHWSYADDAPLDPEDEQ